jgi:hypothetical protein
MARQIANVDIITDSFEIWLLETNELLHALSTEIITANTTFGITGNSTISRTAQLWGTFGANNIVVSTALRGGNANGDPGSTANLVITTNATAYVAATADIRVLAGNSTSNSFINPIGVYLGLGSANSFVNTSAIITQSSATVNTNISSTRIQIANSTTTANVTSSSFTTGLFTGNTTMVSVGANIYANATSLYVGNSTFNSTFGNGSLTGSANLVITTPGYLTISGAANVTSNANFANTIAVTGNATLSNTLAVTGNTALSNTLVVTGNTTLANTLAVTGATTVANTLGIGGTTTFQTDYSVDVLANGNIGATLGPVLIYRFPKSSFSTAKFEVQVKNGNTQISELVLAHDNESNAFVTTYGTVSSNGAPSPLGTFSANTDTANVNLYLVQTVAASAVKVIAHLIK